MSTAVIIPTYNRAATVTAAIESVLAQALPVDEIIVVDDGSTDNTGDLVRARHEPVTYVRRHRAGQSSARNLGVTSSSADRIMFLDSDDVLLPTAVERLSTALDARPDCGAAYCGWVVTDAPGHVVSESDLDFPSGRILAQMCSRHLCIVHSVMVRRSCLDISGLFDTNLTKLEDVDFFIRLAERFPFVFVPERLVEYRRWEAGASRDLAGVGSAVRVLLARLSRYRREGLLDKQEWRRARDRFLGYREERYVGEAFRAYQAGDWRAAYSGALAAFINYPKSLLRRGVWAMAVKSLLRSRQVRREEGAP